MPTFLTHAAAADIYTVSQKVTHFAVLYSIFYIKLMRIKFVASYSACGDCYKISACTVSYAGWFNNIQTIGLTTVRPHLLSALEFLGNWTDGRLLVGTRRIHFRLLLFVHAIRMKSFVVSINLYDGS